MVSIKTLFFVTVFLVIDHHPTLSSPYAPIVHIHTGKVRGLRVKLHDDSIVHFYEGIRYGQAKRFERPRFADNWSGVYNATQRRDACPQLVKYLKDLNYLGSATRTISEDCLYLNVYKPEVAPKILLPVMVYIHGGSFKSGTIFSDAYDARYMSQIGKVIVVTINYRLGAFGFLYGAIEQVPGNQGLHDQILALKWVQKNIQQFGGDPNQVTAFGESAGSMALGALVLSPLTKNLFQRAILQSGSPNSYVGSCDKNKALDKTISLAKRLHCIDEWSSFNMTQIIECLKTKTIDEILHACKLDLLHQRLMTPIYGDDIMPISPIEALKRKQFNPIDLMFGVTRNEGSGFVTRYVPMMNPDIKNPHITIGMAKSGIFLMMLIFEPHYALKIVKFYTTNLNASNPDDLRLAIADSFGDFHLVCPTMLYGEHFARANMDHHYYSYRLTFPLTSGPFSCRGWQGVCHGEDVAFLFLVPANHRLYSREEIQLSNDMIKAWTKFAYTGHPGSISEINWTEAIDHKQSKSSIRFMSLDPRNYTMVENFFKVKCDDFWSPIIFV